MDSFFEVVDDGVYRAADMAFSNWGPDNVAGPAVVGLLAQVLEDEQGVPGFIPARTTVDLLRAFRSKPTRLRTEVIRDGSRIRVSRVEAVQGDHIVAVATMLQLRASQNAPGDRWRAEPTTVTPDFDTDPRTTAWFHTDASGWTTEIADHVNADRLTAWWNPPPIVPDRAPSPYVRAMTVAEWTSMVTNLGTQRMAYINCDITMSLSRIPDGEWIGVQAMWHDDDHGVAVGLAGVHDRRGAIGTGTVSSLNNIAAVESQSADTITSPRRTPWSDDHAVS